MTTTVLDPALAQEAVVAAAPESLSRGERLKILLAGGFVLLLYEFATPYTGLVGIPITFFLKNKLHMPAEATAAFNWISSIPLFVSFAFGFLRDRWSLGAGDRGILVGFGIVTAILYAALAFVKPTYPVMLAGVLIVGTAYLMAGSAARALTSAIGQKNGVTGQASTIVNLATLVPGVVAFFLGGLLSQALEGKTADTAARILFLVGAGFMLAVALFGVLGPKRLFEHAAPEKVSATFVGDIGRLLGHWPIYPALLIYAIWQFGPAAGTALTYHLADDLHATDAQVGLWNALFSAGFVPMVGLYALFSRRLKLSWLLWIGTAFAIPQFAPFLFIHNVNDALIAGFVMGVLGAVGQCAYTDLAIRSAPPGLQGTMMMFLVAAYWLPVRSGDILGAWLYQRAGGFQTAVIATIAVYALIAPLLFAVPRRLTNWADAQAPQTSA